MAPDDPEFLAGDRPRPAAGRPLRAEPHRRRALAFARAEAATLRSLFEHVAIVTWSGDVRGRVGGNVVLVASARAAALGGDPRRGRAGDPGATVIGEPRGVDAFLAGAPVLTDDFAPADQLIERLAAERRRGSA